MTFKLKGYNELKEHFAETVEILLKRPPKKESIEELEEPRRSQVKFINYTIDILDRGIELAKQPQMQKALAEATHILNGAMSLVSTRITENLGHIQRNSLLRDRLNLAMGIKDDQRPSNFDLNECYKKLNNFFKLIFVERDSRKGFKKNHALQYIPLDCLAELIKRSYELEEEAHKNAVADYDIDGASAATPSYYKVDYAIPESVLTPFTAWETLQVALQQLETDELADKNIADINLLRKERAAQLNFLKKLAKTLADLPASAAIKDPLKKAILAGAMCVVREQIGQKEYSKDPLSHDDISGSVIHTGLTTILKAKANSPENIELLLHTARDFMMYMAAEPKKFRASHLFSDIKDFSLPATLELIQHTIKSCRTTALDREVLVLKRAEAAKEDVVRLAKEEEARPTKKSEPVSGGLVGFLGSMLFGATAKPKPADKVKVDETASLDKAVIDKPVVVDEQHVHSAAPH